MYLHSDGISGMIVIEYGVGSQCETLRWGHLEGLFSGQVEW